MTGIETLRQWLNTARRAAFLGGAGVSTASGEKIFLPLPLKNHPDHAGGGTLHKKKCLPYQGDAPLSAPLPAAKKLSSPSR